MAATASTHITNIRVFDGENVRPERSVTIEGTTIAAIGSTPPEGAEIIDGGGGTLLPGLIDGHAHTSLDTLRLARTFGVTTELEMMGSWTPQQRAEIAEDDDVADVRTALAALMARNGHPAPLLAELGDLSPVGAESALPYVSTPDEAVAHVRAMVAGGADYVKIMIEDGDVLGLPGLPLIDSATLRAGVEEAHRLDRRVTAHALTEAATWQAIEAGVDGLAHLFFDRPHTEDIIAAIADRGMFVTPCLVFTSSMMGTTGAALAADPRVASRLPELWLETLRGSHDRFRQGRFDDVLATVAALRDAGVDIIAGTDAAIPVPAFGGVVHGASVHHELQLLVAAGLTPVEALRAATTVPARRFGLGDRGRIEPGARADLVLVAGDPTIKIDDSLSLGAVWRRGAKSA